jgi:hypothetical protein
MTGTQGRANNDDDHHDSPEDEALDEGEYDAMMLLERLESLEDEMLELGVHTLDELRARIRDLHAELGE